MGFLASADIGSPYCTLPQTDDFLPHTSSLTPSTHSSGYPSLGIPDSGTEIIGIHYAKSTNCLFFITFLNA